MEYLNGIRVKYTHPAFPPQPLKVNVSWTYRIQYIDDKLYIFDGNLAQSIDEIYLKILFSPIDYESWERINPHKKYVKKSK